MKNVVDEGHVQKDDLIHPVCDFKSPPHRTWKLKEHEEQELRQIFEELDENADGILSEEERNAGAKRLDAFLVDFGVALDGLRQKGNLTFAELNHSQPVNFNY
jgi:hypothetical protein